MDYAAPKGTIEVLQALFYLCAAGLCIAGMIRLLKGKSPMPPNEQLESTIADIKGHIAEIKEDNSKIWARITANRDEAEASNEKRAHDLHVRLNPVAEDIREVRGQMQAFTLAFENFTKLIVALAHGKKL